jgi:FMN phosphatase YigB (HAD superfamily)
MRQRPSLVMFDLMGTLLVVDDESDSSAIDRLLREDGIDPGDDFEGRYMSWRKNRSNDCDVYSAV